MFGRKFFGSVAFTALSVAALAPPAIAQETTATIRGTVSSTAGAAISGARVTVVHTPTGTRSVSTSNAQGAFDLRGLRVGGPYTIEIAKDAFESQTLDQVFVLVGEPLRLDAALQESNEVVVTAVRPKGRIQIVGAGSSVVRDDIQGAVSINRDIRDFARRDPLVSANSRSDGGISIAGSNPRLNRITIDGVQAQDSFGLNTGGLPTRRGPVSPDAVEQLAVTSVPFDVVNGDFTGGAIDVFLRQGTNEFDGSVYAYYLNEGLVGTRIGNTTTKAFVTQENFGGTLRGPIIPDTLFFALSYESFESADTTPAGPVGGGFSSGIIGPDGVAGSMSLANIKAVTDVFTTATGYNSRFPLGSIPLTKPITDEKYTARIDWNITDNHRLSATYRHAESGVIQRTNIPGNGNNLAGLDSQWYLTGEDDTTLSVQLNSDWTNNFSTEFRFSQRDYERLQEPPSGQNFADISVCSVATSNLDTGSSPTTSCRDGSRTAGQVRFGPDQFRHANKLNTTGRNAHLMGTYELGAHVLKFGGQWEETDIFNLFVPNSDGTYYFDSIADFQAGRANQLIYRNALSNNPTDAAAAFKYSVFSGFVQDTWDITEDLTLIYGVRYDTYVSDDKPARNPNFTNRTRLSNQVTYDGLDVIMPRVAFDWNPTEILNVSGGVGLFSGGLPDVFLSNSFSNTGTLDNTLTFVRETSARNATSLQVAASEFITETSGTVNCSLAAQSSICTDALNVAVNSAFGTTIPASIRAAIGGAPTNAETNSLAPDFEIPSDWRANLAFKVELENGWRFGADVVGMANNEGLAFRDLRAAPLVVNGARARTPDGRLRYDGLATAQRTSIAGTTVASSNPGTNRDIQAYNPDEESYTVTAAISAGRDFDNGLSFDVAYVRQNAREYAASARFSSTASSLYGGQYTSVDPNTAKYGRSQEEIEDAVKLNVTWRREFVEGLETRFTLFGDYRSGRPSSFTMRDPASGRGPVFGVNRGGHLAYIPNLSGTLSTATGLTFNGAAADATTANRSATTISSDNLVSFADVATYNSLVTLVNRFGIPQGGIVPRGTYTNNDIARFDLQVSQEIPVFFKNHRALFTVDIQNLANLVNEDWGIVEEFPEDFRLFDVACAGADGIADNDGALSCSRYRISGVNSNQAVTRNTDLSRWAIQLGIKYEF